MVSRWIVLVGALSALGLFAVLGVFLAVDKPEAAAAPDYRVAPARGIEYEAMSGRPIDPASAVDRQLIAGLPAAERRLRHGEILFGAFISFTNVSSGMLRSAEHIDLRIDDGPVYQPLALPATNPYAYSPRVIRPRTRVPALGSPADANLAATGKLVLFRIPGRPYRNGATLELVIHQAHHDVSLSI
jgi:hypothetical protein